MSYITVNPFTSTFSTYDLNHKISRTTVFNLVRFKMLKHGTITDGTLTLEVFDGAISLGSTSITFTEFETVGATYAYGYFRFEFDEPIAVNIDNTIVDKELIFRVTMSGHTENSNKYIGMLREFENPIITEYGSRPATVSAEEDGWFNPFGIEIHEVA